MSTARIILACLLGAGWALLPIDGQASRCAAEEPLTVAGEVPAAWRKQDHDGANCLYLFLALSGRKVDYAEVTAALEATGRGRSLAGLREAAQRLGLNASIYRWGPSQLVHSRCPVIAHLDSYDGQGGSFVLVFKSFETHCDTVNGANATLQELRAEDFRRVWSGYVLAPTLPAPSRKAELLSCGMGALILVGYGWFRVRRVVTLPGTGARSSVS
jgi:hypothetical protein